jgi:hypothetical protein
MDLYGLEHTGKEKENGKSTFLNSLESLGRGSVAGSVGVIGDLRELERTIGSYLPKALRNVQSAAGLFANPGAAMLKAKAPSSETTLDLIPRISDDHEYSDGFEMVGGFIGPGAAIPAALKRASVNGINKVAGNNLPKLLPPPAATPVEEAPKIAGLLPPPAKEVSEALRKVKPAKAPKPEPYKAPRNEMGFYSALDEAVGNIQSPRGTGEQYLKQLQKTPGVKAEEISYRGLDKFLAENPKTSVEDIKAYLAENQVKLDEVTLRGPGENMDAYNDFPNEFREGDRQSLIEDLAEQEFDYYKSEYGDQYRQDFMQNRGYTDEDLLENPDLAREADEYVDEVAADNARNSAEEYAEEVFEHEVGYTIRGNDNMGEWRVEDPRGRTVSWSGRDYMRSREEAFEAAQNDALDSGYIEMGSSDGVQYDSWKLNGADDSYREQLIKHESAAGGYDAPHFDGHSEDLLMHNRLSDRMSPDGKRMLFSEEMQSDWLQTGRNEGFRPPDLKEQMQQNRDAKAELNKLAYNAAPEDYARYTEEMAQLDRDMEGLHKMQRNMVPDAPFKKTYHEFLAKKNLAEAAEGGYDRFAWSPGKIHADRYNMNKHVDDIRYYPLTNSLEGYKNKQHVLSRSLESPEDLDMLMGKEFAKRLRETPTTVHPDSGVEYHAMAGEPMDIGDKRAAGMRNYYDEKVPNFLSNYLKKYNVQPGTTEVAGKPVHYVDITPEMREDFNKRGQPMFALTPLGMPMMDPNLQFEQEDEQPTQADIAAALRYIP